jgi:hypothetical protein
MLEIATAILGLVSALMFAIHAMDAYRSGWKRTRERPGAQFPDDTPGQWPPALLLRGTCQNAGTGRPNKGSSPSPPLENAGSSFDR